MVGCARQGRPGTGPGGVASFPPPGPVFHVGHAHPAGAGTHIAGRLEFCHRGAMAVLPLLPGPSPSRPLLPSRRASAPAPDDFNESEATAEHAEVGPAAPVQSLLIADLATVASRVESLISSTCQAYDDMSMGRTSDLPRKSQRVTDMLELTRAEARRLLGLAYQMLAEAQQGR